MSGRQRSFWHWPGWPQLRYALWLGLLQAVLFGILYGGSNWVAQQHSYRVPLHVRADLAVPLVAWMSIFHLSMTSLLWLAPFVLRTSRQLQGIVLAQAVATVIASIFFVLLPAQEAFPHPEDGQLGTFAGVFHLARSIALRHNYFPSLHVTFTTICIMAYSPYASGAGKALLWSWGGAIIASTRASSVSISDFHFCTLVSSWAEAS